ncbi:hypothetical protein COU57_04495 [Candidatus Pacearchaeota archaeon CG10_big_fil_rev_8_21_14_0_10_32_14]|nr:MAG: hypothetical protein COU57_04495 [Candidatus Pacearchaeota archaeon CG10_big_fil_rev_8_21_14_0_10_32_14]
MESKKLGVVLVILSLLIGGMFFYYSSSLTNEGQALGCFENVNCVRIERTLTFTHFAVGVFAFLLSLGFYLIFFNHHEGLILKKLEEENSQKIKEEKFSIIMKALDPFEQKVLTAIKEQDGITQNTLSLRVDMSRAKLSYVLQELEKRSLIKRNQKGKTLEIWLRI